MGAKRYTIIDLGSNSFHMLTVTKTDSGFSVFSKHKQKVRLASGLDSNNNLKQSTIAISLDCLRKFRIQLDKIQPYKIIITATAALRLANNKQFFISQAEAILKLPINLISGIEEAKTIYRGVAFTEHIKEQLMVIDIGGASTELIIGQGNKVLKAESLDMGCVTWLNSYFSDNKLNSKNFSLAITAAKNIIQPQLAHYQELNWSRCMGASGTIQAVNEVNSVQLLERQLTLKLLNSIKQQCIRCKQIDKLNIKGLKTSRKPVFPSGLAILIALFECLNIQAISLSKGALREGVISMLFVGDSF
ncbi:guanosine-5'-triphosphate,3'-diphosphate pyrophosphatase [Psychromonas hadalis]|uniref:Ppx/GppA phosphatase family protein n=1 Tax=Psychromonas hadalis TaxID=211669 RepID=UPI00042418D6|nr:guanosine-5'-triphosphate,3'-diphosphate pyrophosphatase [Psychromonas hadalis]